MKNSNLLKRKNDTSGCAGANLTLVVAAARIPAFFELLGHGVLLEVRTGCSVRQLLGKQLGLDEDYIEQRIQTVFLDARPVDDLDAAVVKAGATLSLSAAMPGLAGATLRRGGFYAAMRGSISHCKDRLPEKTATGRVTVKLFNMTARQLGPEFLKRGVWIKAAVLRDFFARRSRQIQPACSRAELDGQAIALPELSKADLGVNPVYLQVTAVME